MGLQRALEGDKGSGKAEASAPDLEFLGEGGGEGLLWLNCWGYDMAREWLGFI